MPAVAVVLAVCLAVAVLSTMMDRPDADDITFFRGPPRRSRTSLPPYSSTT